MSIDAKTLDELANSAASIQVAAANILARVAKVKAELQALAEEVEALHETETDSPTDTVESSTTQGAVVYLFNVEDIGDDGDDW